MEISLVFQEHPDENIWEEYAFGRLHNAAEARLEEHLLVCPTCQSTLTRTDEFICLMKHSIRPAERPPHAVPQPSRVVPFPASITARRGGVTMATALAAAGLAATIWMGPHQAHGPRVAVYLHSLRGAADTQFDHAPAGHRLDLTIRTSDVPPSSGYKLEVVDAGGKRLWSGAVNVKDSLLSAHIDQALGAGLYWVRLYSQASEELAEYGLRLE